MAWAAFERHPVKKLCRQMRGGAFHLPGGVVDFVVLWYTGGMEKSQASDAAGARKG